MKTIKLVDKEITRTFESNYTVSNDSYIIKEQTVLKPMFLYNDEYYFFEFFEKNDTPFTKLVVIKTPVPSNTVGLLKTISAIKEILEILLQEKVEGEIELQENPLYFFIKVEYNFDNIKKIINSFTLNEEYEVLVKTIHVPVA